MKINSFKELAEAVKGNAKKSRVAIACANDLHTVESAVTAQKDGLVEAVLIGDEASIRENLEKTGASPADYDIIATSGMEESLAKAVELIHSKAANVFMKGQLETGDFMRAILNKDNNLRRGSLLSVAGFFELESYHKLIAVTDMAINLYPDLAAKKAITENAVALLNAFGIETPKVAVLAAVEKLNPKMKETVDADALKQMCANGEIANCVIDGPLSFDIATSAEAAAIKGYKSPVAGDADLLVVPDLVCGNVLAKAMTGLAGATTAGAVVGAAVPVVLTPRSAEASDKYYSIALAAYTAQNY